MAAAAPSGLLFRTLETLGRAQATAQVSVRARGGRRGTVMLVGGRLVSIDGDGLSDRILGDRIQREVPEATGLELDERSPGERIGDYLVRVGRVPEGAVLAAVRRQVRERLAALLAWEVATADVRNEAAGETDPSLEPALDALVWALRRLGRELPAADPSAPLRLGMAGRRWLRGAPLRPSECALRDALERTDDSTVERLLRQDAALGGFVSALCHVGALRRYVAEGGYARLAQAVHRLRLGHAPVPEDRAAGGSDAEARRALRRAAAALHPDHFARDPEAIRVASEAAMRRVLALAESGAVPRRRR